MTRASDTAKLLGAGATILDGTTISTADNTDSLILLSTDADANVGPNLNLYRNSGSPADNDVLGLIIYNGRNDNSQDVIYARQISYIKDASDGTEDGQLTLQTMVAGTIRDRLNINPTEIVLNEDSQDVDFRVESNGQANMLFVDGGNNRVGINTGSPASGYMLHVGGSSGVHTKVKIEATTNTGQAELDLSADPAGVSYLNLGDEDSSNIGYLGYFHSDNSMRFQTNSAEQVRIHSNGVLSASDGIALGVGTANTASNVISDYEEGTWTPAYASDNSSGYATQVGTYTKIGQQVTAYFSVVLNNNQIGSTTLRLAGLPFTANASGNYGATSGMHCNGWAASANKPDNGIVPPNTAYIDLYHSQGTTGTNLPTGSNLGAGSLIGLVTYRAA